MDDWARCGAHRDSQSRLSNASGAAIPLQVCLHDPAGGMGSSLGVFFPLQLGLGRIIYKFGYPGGREASSFSPLQLGKKCLAIELRLTIQEGGMLVVIFSLQLKLFLFIDQKYHE